MSAVRVAVAPQGGAAVAGLVYLPTSGRERAARQEGRRLPPKRVPPPRPAQLDRDLAKLDDVQGVIRIDKRSGRLARLRRGVGFSARAHLQPERGFRPPKAVMLTLTYRDGADWRPRDVSDLLKCYRRWCKVEGIKARYVWVAEVQQRGVPHYHVCVFVPEHVFVPFPDQAGWWEHGSTNVIRAKSAPAYLMKYLSKGLGASDLHLPEGARMFGRGGLEEWARRSLRWYSYPGFIKARADINARWDRATGGGWYSPDGMRIPSEFQRAWVGDGFGAVRVADYGRPFKVDGPYSKWTPKP